MNWERETSRVLEQEHRENLELMAQLEARLARAGRNVNLAEPELARLLTQLAGHLEREVARHFDFEEQELFPRLQEAGDGDIVALLTDEHAAIREVAAELQPLARAAGRGELAAADTPLLVRSTMELIERQMAHIQKEGMALLPLLEDLLDEDTDRELAMAYASA
ncbi:MAG: hemerythrin domain-containing protein [Ideonella sp.]|nr:hemerythrin domain-containing protein [Ideonella sp.]MCC7458279.1 hemerythrin domain-containing protein [Nitrospira sp.]